VRIAQVSPWFYPHLGGVESHVEALAHELAGRGHEVTVVSTRDDLRSPEWERVDGFQVLRVKPRMVAMRTPIAPMAWSPDGKWLLYGDNAAGLMVLDVQTRESWLLQKEAQPGTWAGWGRADWSPDGRFIVVDRERPARKERLSWSGVTADATARLLQKRPGS